MKIVRPVVVITALFALGLSLSCGPPGPGPRPGGECEYYNAWECEPDYDVGDSDFWANPSWLTFPTLAVGDSMEETIAIGNVGDGTLVLSNFRIGSVDGSNAEAFVKGPDWPRYPLALQEGDFIDLRVIYEPQEAAEYSGAIYINTNLYGLSTVRILLNALEVAPEISGPERISFLDVPVGSSKWQVVAIENIGPGPLYIDDIFFDGESGFEVTFPGEFSVGDDFPPVELDSQEIPQVLLPGDGPLYLRVWYHANDHRPKIASLVISSNDLTHPEFNIEVTGNMDLPCLEVVRNAEIDFGVVRLGQTASRKVGLRNCSRTSSVAISQALMSESDGDVFLSYYFGGSPDEPYILGPQEMTNIGVGYRPLNLARNSGELIIVSDDPAQPRVEIALSGEGGHANSPVAAARGAVWDPVTPADSWQIVVTASLAETIELNGENSSDPTGTELTYEWTLIERPPGSRAEIENTSAMERPRLWLDAVGDYVVELMVINENGLASRSPTYVYIHSEPESDITVHVSWYLPGDPEPQPSVGPDLDLHYVHENGSWGDGLWSLFYANLSAEWDEGLATMVSVSNRIDRPEIIAHDGPQEGRSYRVGLFNNDDLGQGPVHADARIYFGDVLIWKSLNRPIEEIGDLWLMGEIHWSEEPIFTEIDEIITDSGLIHAGGW